MFRVWNRKAGAPQLGCSLTNTRSSPPFFLAPYHGESRAPASRASGRGSSTLLKAAQETQRQRTRRRSRRSRKRKKKGGKSRGITRDQVEAVSVQLPWEPGSVAAQGGGLSAAAYSRGQRKMVIFQQGPWGPQEPSAPRGQGWALCVLSLGQTLKRFCWGRISKRGCVRARSVQGTFTSTQSTCTHVCVCLSVQVFTSAQKASRQPEGTASSQPTPPPQDSPLPVTGLHPPPTHPHLLVQALNPG